MTSHGNPLIVCSSGQIDDVRIKTCIRKSATVNFIPSQQHYLNRCPGFKSIMSLYTQVMHPFHPVCAYRVVEYQSVVKGRCPIQVQHCCSQHCSGHWHHPLGSIAFNPSCSSKCDYKRPGKYVTGLSYIT